VKRDLDEKISAGMYLDRGCFGPVFVHFIHAHCCSNEVLPEQSVHNCFRS